jgi:hypothetical protein
VIDRDEMRKRALEWIAPKGCEPVTRETAISEEVMALDVIELLDENERLRTALRRVPIVRAIPDGATFSGYECPGCGSRSGITIPDGANVEEPCAAGCWVAPVEAALHGEAPDLRKLLTETIALAVRLAGLECDSAAEERLAAIAKEAGLA